MLEQLATSYACNDRPTLLRAAHTIKGAVSHFTDGPVLVTARRLEQSLKQHGSGDFKPEIDTLQGQVQELRGELMNYLGATVSLKCLDRCAQ